MNMGHLCGDVQEATGCGRPEPQREARAGDVDLGSGVYGSGRVSDIGMCKVKRGG